MTKNQMFQPKTDSYNNLYVPYNFIYNIFNKEANLMFYL